MTTIRVMIVDTQSSVRQGLSVYLELYDNLMVVAEAADGVEAVEMCGEVLPDVVLMDVAMPRMDGVTATKLIREKYPRTQIIALTNINVETVRQQMLDAGAYSYVLKTEATDELIKRIVAASEASGLG